MSTTTNNEARRDKAPAGERVADWADGRLGIYSLAKANMRKIFPDHWSFMLGEVCLYSFIIIILTGVYLTLFFHPSMNEVEYHGSYVPLQGQLMSEAFSSTLHISFDVRGGLLIRQIHHWAALIFLAGMFVHMMRVFFTGAFRKPREINWLFGFLLFVLGMFTGFTGYSLPDDLLSGTGVRFTEGAILSMPIVGTYISFFLFGGEFPGDDFVARFYSIHILLLPGIMLGLVVGAPDPGLLPQAHAVRGPRQDQQERRRHAAAAGLHGQGRRLLLPGLRCHRGHRGDRPDQPDLGHRPLPARTRSPPAPSPTGTWASPRAWSAYMPGWEINFWGHTLVLGVFIPLVLFGAGAGGHRGLPVHRVLGHRRQARAPHPGPPAQRPDAYRVRRRLGHGVLIGSGRRWQRPVGHPLPPVDQRGHLVRPDRLLRRTGPRVHRHQADLPRPPAPGQGQGAARPRVRHHQAPAAR